MLSLTHQKASKSLDSTAKSVGFNGVIELGTMTTSQNNDSRLGFYGLNQTQAGNPRANVTLSWEYRKPGLTWFYYVPDGTLYSSLDQQFVVVPGDTTLKANESEVTMWDRRSATNSAWTIALVATEKSTGDYLFTISNNKNLEFHLSGDPVFTTKVTTAVAVAEFRQQLLVKFSNSKSFVTVLTPIEPPLVPIIPSNNNLINILTPLTPLVPPVSPLIPLGPPTNLFDMGQIGFDSRFTSVVTTTLDLLSEAFFEKPNPGNDILVQNWVYNLNTGIISPRGRLDISLEPLVANLDPVFQGKGTAQLGLFSAKSALNGPWDFIYNPNVGRGNPSAGYLIRLRGTNNLYMASSGGKVVVGRFTGNLPYLAVQVPPNPFEVIIPPAPPDSLSVALIIAIIVGVIMAAVAAAVAYRKLRG